MGTVDWRARLEPEARQRFLTQIMDAIQRNIPFSGDEGLCELSKIAERFEQKLCTAATIQMLTMESKLRNAVPNYLPTNHAAASSGTTPDQGSLGRHSQVHSKGKSTPVPLPTNQHPMFQQQFSTLPPSSNLRPISMPMIASQNPTMQHNQIPLQHVYHQLEQQVLKAKFPQGIVQSHVSTLLPHLQLHSQSLPQVEQVLSQIQSQLSQIQQHLGLQQDVPPRLPSSGPLLQPQNAIDQQERALPETPLTSQDSTAQIGSANDDDWKEEIHQKIKQMKDLYLPKLNEMYQRIVNKLTEHGSQLQHPKSEQYEKLELFKAMLERAMSFLQVPKSNIVPGFKDKLAHYERQIINFIETNKPRKQQSQTTEIHSRERQMNPQLGSAATSQQQISVTAHPGVSTPQQNMMDYVADGFSGTDYSGQGNALNSFQRVKPEQ